MIEKTKNIIFTISIFYSIVIIIFMSITTINMNDTIVLSDSEDNKNTLIEYKKQLSELEKNDCTSMIEKLIKHYEDTSYAGNINIRTIYEYDMENSIISYYLDTKNKCNLTDELAEKHNLPIKFLTASIQNNEIYQQYYFKYELSLKDFKARLVGEPNMTHIEYMINRTMELEIIESLIKLSNKEDIINE